MNPGKELARLRKIYWTEHPEEYEEYRKRLKAIVKKGLRLGTHKRGKNGRFEIP